MLHKNIYFSSVDILSQEINYDTPPTNTVRLQKSFLKDVTSIPLEIGNKSITEKKRL